MVYTEDMLLISLLRGKKIFWICIAQRETDSESISECVALTLNWRATKTNIWFKIENTAHYFFVLFELRGILLLVGKYA